MSAQPRLVVSAPSSGHGKTAIAVGLLAAATARGIQAAGFKVGPDHTDAAYLGMAAGRPGRNLDPRLVGAQRVAPLFAHGASGAQLSIIEGAMGLFDSLTGQPEIDGTAAVAASLRAPVVLVVDVAAMGHSIAALVHGFRMFDEMVHLGGVILNRVASSRHEQMLRTALDDIGMPVLGALRRGDLPNVLPARAHGPVPVAHRTMEAIRAVRRLGEAVGGCLDLDRLMALAGSAPALPGALWSPAEAVGGEVSEQRPVVALAGGPGALFTYAETAELLSAAGAEVMVVDPLRDESLPAGTRALVVGAGLPEGYAEELSANRRLSAEVARFALDGWPVVAEGVALPWLARDLDGRPMCGVLDASAVTGEQTVAGYREATAPTTSSMAPAGARITGYKQHRAIVTPRAGVVPAWTWSGGHPEGFVWRQVHASQLGLHWAAAPEIAKRIVGAAMAGPVPSAPPGHQAMPTTLVHQIPQQTTVPVQQIPHNAMPAAQSSAQGPQNAVPAQQGSMAGPHNAVPAQQGSMPGPHNAMPAPQPMPGPQNAMPAAGHAVPPAGHAVLPADYAVPPASGTPAAGQALPPMSGMPALGQALPPMSAMPTAGHAPGMPPTSPHSPSPAMGQPFSVDPLASGAVSAVYEPTQQLSPAQLTPESPAEPPANLSDTLDITAP
ncbi:cobyrinate a,c-diamide synthase [Actinoplanes sp. TBRC 11911]|uniref:cobyrinate a,c-diamide synthase n=1 Tax=Actinoplanes sp. TBRC 11911 TaxID=2729386 RepID=UPI00200716A7|nr:cobyrinate a,c-diamide synthase [Actinoplanes sp. TBRC 11911]